MTAKPLARITVHAHAKVMPSAVARNAKTPLATRRPASDDDDEALGELAEDDTNVAAGVAVATAFTPPVTGPLSVTYKSHEEDH